MSHEKTKAVTTRYPIDHHLQMPAEAESTGCSVADILKRAWITSRGAESTKQHLLTMERRIKTTTFEIVCAVLGTTVEERDLAMKGTQI